MKHIPQLLVTAAVIRTLILGSSLNDAIIIGALCLLHGVLVALERKEEDKSLESQLKSLAKSDEEMKKAIDELRSSVGGLKIGTTRKF